MGFGVAYYQDVYRCWSDPLDVIDMNTGRDNQHAQHMYTFLALVDVCGTVFFF